VKRRSPATAGLLATALLAAETPTALAQHRSRLIDEFQLLEFVRRGHITGPAGVRYGSVGIRVNCPIVHRFL